MKKLMILAVMAAMTAAARPAPCRGGCCGDGCSRTTGCTEALRARLEREIAQMQALLARMPAGHPLRRLIEARIQALQEQLWACGPC